jgi:hypothetical protein
VKLVYYPGHSWAWIDSFLEVLPKDMNRRRAILLLEAIQQRYSCTRKLKIILDKQLLKRFGLNSRHIRPYLECWKKAKLMDVQFRNRASPIVFLTSPPPAYTIYFLKRKRE